MMTTENMYDVAYAQSMDQQDELSSFREKFFLPKGNDGLPKVYLCGNSLGLQPKSVKDYLQQELDDWANKGVEGHVTAKNPWVNYHKMFQKPLAEVVGALPHEVVVMNTLTANLHLLFVSFYRPTQQRYKIIMEAKAFSSDQYAVESQVRFHGFNPDDAIIELKPREGEYYIRPEDIYRTIEENADSLALLFLGGVNYYTGQLFDMKGLTEAAQKVGAIAGYDLAHAAGNVKMQLHEWNVDFAAWCSYKYLNSGPGGPAGIFVHDKYANDTTLPRFAGWWGSREDVRFKMVREFEPMPGAAGWQQSNAQVLAMAAQKASLDIFTEAGIERLTNKSRKLTAYLAVLLNELQEEFHGSFNIITPLNENERGAQLSLHFLKNGKSIFAALGQKNVVADWREPDVIRIAPAPLYNSFQDVFRFYQLLKTELKNYV